MDGVVGCWKYMNTSLHSKRLVRPTGGLYAFTLVGSNTADVRRLATGKACRCNVVAIGVLNIVDAVVVQSTVLRICFQAGGCSSSRL